MLERDEAPWLHSNSVCEVAQLKAHVDYLQAALQVVDEEITEARCNTLKFASFKNRFKRIYF